MQQAEASTPGQTVPKHGPTGEQRSLPRRMVELLRRLAEACDSTIPSSWIRTEAPASLLLFAIWLLPFMGAGMVRAVVGGSTEVGLVVALLGEVLLAATFLAQRRAASPAERSARTVKAAAIFVGLTLVAWCWKLFYSRDMGSLVANYGLDGGSHVGYRRQFIESDPSTYFGFVSLYSVTHLLDRLLPPRPAVSFAIAFYSTLATVAVAPLVAMVTVLQNMETSAKVRLAGMAAFAVVWVFALQSFVVPVLANIQADGFYGQLFGFLPFALVWLAVVLLKPRLLRVIWAGLAVVLCRFTYGLNLPDALIACGTLWLFDSVKSRRRLIPLAIGGGAIVAALLGYRALIPSFKNGGYVEVYPFADALRTMREAVLAVGLYGIVTALAAGRAGRAVPDPPMAVSRALRWPVLLAFVSLVSSELFRRIPRAESYYVLKHPQMPLVWLAAAACIALGHVTALTLTGRGHVAIVGLGLAMTLVLGRLSSQADRTFTELRAELEDRNAPPPHTRLRPLVDKKTWDFIQTTLNTQHKKFGGYVSRDFPVAHFLNAWMGFQNQYQLFVAPAPTPNTCVFWDHPEDDPNYTYHPNVAALEASRSSLEADPLKRCETVKEPWSVNPRTLCSRCF